MSIPNQNNSQKNKEHANPERQFMSNIRAEESQSNYQLSGFQSEIRNRKQSSKMREDMASQDAELDLLEGVLKSHCRSHLRKASAPRRNKPRKIRAKAKRGASASNRVKTPGKRAKSTFHHEDFFRRSYAKRDLEQKRQREYEDGIKKRSENPKISSNSKFLLEQRNLRRLRSEISEVTQENQGIDFKAMGELLARLGFLLILRFEHSGGHQYIYIYLYLYGLKF